MKLVGQDFFCRAVLDKNAQFLNGLMRSVDEICEVDDDGFFCQSEKNTKFRRFSASNAELLR